MGAPLSSAASARRPHDESAPMPRVRRCGILQHAVAQPTRHRIRVTGTPISRMLNRLRIGLCFNFRDQLAGHFFLFLDGVGRWQRAGVGRCPSTAVVPSGCSSTNLSSVTPLLMSIFTMSITTPYSSRGRLISMCLGNGTLS